MLKSQQLWFEWSFNRLDVLKMLHWYLFGFCFLCLSSILQVEKALTASGKTVQWLTSHVSQRDSRWARYMDLISVWSLSIIFFM